MPLTKKRLLLRVAVVFTASVVIWRFMILFFHREAMQENPLWHIAAGIFTSALVCILLFAVSRIEKTKSDWSWPTVCHSLKGFANGFLCWTIPAGISVLILSMVGWVVIRPQVSAATLIGQMLIVLVAVFLVEAFPEELIRGYMLSRLGECFSPWVALVIQTGLFTLFAFCVGSLYSIDQFLFIPGFGFLLGYFWMLSGTVSFSMGFHVAIMTGTQLMAPSRQLVEVEGNFFLLRILAFVIVPATVGSVILHLRAGYSDR